MVRSQGSQTESESGDDQPGGVSLAEIPDDEMDLDDGTLSAASSMSSDTESQHVANACSEIPPHFDYSFLDDSDHDQCTSPSSDGLETSAGQDNDAMDMNFDLVEEVDDLTSTEADTMGNVSNSLPLPSTHVELATLYAQSEPSSHPLETTVNAAPFSVLLGPLNSNSIVHNAGVDAPGNILNTDYHSSPMFNHTYVDPPVSLPIAVPHLQNIADMYGWEEDETRNFDLVKLIQYWKDVCCLHQYSNYSPQQFDYFPPIGDKICRFEGRHERTKIVSDEVNDGYCDMQGIDWSDLGVKREAVRDVRIKTYVNHTNVLPHPYHQTKDYEPIFGSSRYMNLEGRAMAKDVPNYDQHFRFLQMNMKYKAQQTHFQLRHMISASSKNSVFQADYRKVFSVNPEMDEEKCAMDLSIASPGPEPIKMEKISTITATDGVLLAGGFEGEYAFKSLSAEYQTAYTPGRIDLKNNNGSTNHIHTFLSRQSGLPQAVFSSNDDRLHILDLHTNCIVSEHDFGWAINCSATSPDTRLRLIVGDNCDPWIVNAETGTRVVRLPNHRDYGFACAWSPDGLNIATGNQDGTVQIFDTRSFRLPLQSHILPTDLGGVRTMQFSPHGGGGKRVLVLAESADFIHVLDAETFQSKQTFDFFGEIGGVSFTPDGSKFFVANTDARFGGLMEFERDEPRVLSRRGDEEDWLFGGEGGLDEEIGWGGMMMGARRRKRRLERSLSHL